MTEPASDEHHAGWRDWVIVIVLSLTTILAAWSAFQASNWNGKMSISFSQASAARVESSKLDGDANRVAIIQVGLFTQWLAAESVGDSQRSAYLASVFPEPLASAFRAWRAADPQVNPEAPRTPFEMPEYAIPEDAEATAAEARADETFDEALEFNQHSDNYTLLTVLFAAVLFFASLSGRARSRSVQHVFLGLALILLFIASGLLITFPKLV